MARILIGVAVAAMCFVACTEDAEDDSTDAGFNGGMGAGGSSGGGGGGDGPGADCPAAETCDALRRAQCVDGDACGGCLPGHAPAGGEPPACGPCASSRLEPSSCEADAPFDCGRLTDGDTTNYDEVWCENGDHAACDYRDPTCEGGCIRPVFRFTFDSPTTVSELRYLSDWWSKRPNEWSIWAASVGEGRQAARKVAEGIGREAPWACVNGELCGEEVPDACCPDGRDRPQRIEPDGKIGKWEIHRFPAAEGQTFWFEVDSSYSPGSLGMIEIELRANPCPGGELGGGGAGGTGGGTGGSGAGGTPGPGSDGGVFDLPDIGGGGGDAPSCEAFCERLAECGAPANEVQECPGTCAALDLGVLPATCVNALEAVFRCGVESPCDQAEAACAAVTEAADQACSE